MEDNDRKNGKRRVAIACQGGGSHTAFTAGALKEIMDRHTKQDDLDFEIVGLSGTSGGAICALLAWYGLINDDGKSAKELLTNFWDDNSAKGAALEGMMAQYAPVINDMLKSNNLLGGAYQNYLSWCDSLINSLVVTNLRVSQSMMVSGEPNPYLVPVDWRFSLRYLLDKYVDFKKIKDYQKNTDVLLMIGAVNVGKGDFEVFCNWKRQKNGDFSREFNQGEDGITQDAIIASASIPTLFEAMHIGKDYYWDGLFSQNPPLKDLPDCNPDEIWIIRLDPKTIRREPKSIARILDRRNELSCNLSLEQEIRYLDKINELLITGKLVNTKYKPIKLMEIPCNDPKEELDYPTKMNRDPAFISKMEQKGAAAVSHFFEKTREKQDRAWDSRWDVLRNNGNRIDMEKRTTEILEELMPEVLKKLE